MSKSYNKFPGDIEMEKGFKYAFHFISVINQAGGNIYAEDLQGMTAMELLNLFNTNSIYLYHKVRPQENEEEG